jgi:lysophospholipase L1-like esterase
MAMSHHLRLGFTIVAISSLTGTARSQVGKGAWERDIAAFEKKDLQNPPPKHGVVFVGSSSIRLWDLARSFPGLDAINRGFGGSQLADAVQYAPRIVHPYEPRLVVLYSGENDLAFGKTPEQVSADFREFTRRMLEKLPGTKVIVLSIKPSPSRSRFWDKMGAANDLIREHCKTDRRLHYLDVATALLGPDGTPRPEYFRSDGLHLNEKGYHVWNEILKPYLSKKDGS